MEQVIDDDDNNDDNGQHAGEWWWNTKAEQSRQIPDKVMTKITKQLFWGEDDGSFTHSFTDPVASYK